MIVIFPEGVRQYLRHRKGKWYKYYYTSDIMAESAKRKILARWKDKPEIEAKELDGRLWVSTKEEIIRPKLARR